MNTALSQNIDSAGAEFLEILTETDEFQQRSVGVHLDEEVEIARRTCSTRSGTKDPDVPRAALGGNLRMAVRRL